jgi:hypothetical protein
LRVIEQLRGVERSAFTEMVDVFLNAARRRAAEARQPVQKAGQLCTSILQEMKVKVLGVGDVREVKEADPVNLRTLMRCTVIYFTFCRFSCYQQLQARDFEDLGDSIKVSFRSAKNDQMHNGTETFLVSNSGLDPTQIVRKYFQLCNFKFGMANGDTSFVNSVIVKRRDGTWRADGKKHVSYSQSTGKLRDLLTSMGYEASKVTDKSFKMLGVTRTLETDVTLDEVMNHGRWKKLTMPLHYKVNSAQYKKAVAAKVPV